MGSRVAHTDCAKMVPTVQLYSEVEPEISHSEGDTHELYSRNKITNLIEMWEDPGDKGVKSKEVKEGEGG